MRKTTKKLKNIKLILMRKTTKKIKKAMNYKLYLLRIINIKLYIIII